VEDAFARLSARTGKLGKHYQRFLLTTAAGVAPMVERLEALGLLEDVDLWCLSPSPARQMALLREVGQGERQKLSFLATYYALQFLHMNLLALDHLDLALSAGESRHVAYRDFLGAQGSNYQRLNAAYVESLLAHYLGGQACPTYCMCVVGTRWDQDDVDVIMMHEGNGGLDALNQAIGRVSTEFFRQATRLHLYTAERMRTRSFTSDVQGYSRRLSEDQTDFVMICEMLSAEPLVGSPLLFAEFRRKVTDRFFASRGRTGRSHERFLRGLLGEMHSLMVEEVSRGRIEFKNDALRLAKGMALAGRVIRNLDLVDPVTLIEKLAGHFRDLDEDLENLRDALLMVETFRLLFHMLVVQEEEIELTEESEPLLQSVAAAMGYTSKGGVSAVSHLLVNYSEAVEQVRSVSRKLMLRYTRYLRKTSARTYQSASGTDRVHNIAVELSDSVRMFGGHIFFEDVLEELQEGGGSLAGRLVEDLGSLAPQEQERAIAGFLEFADSDPMTLLELMLTIRSVGSDAAGGMFDTMLERLLARMDQAEGGLLPGLLSVFSSEPALVNRFIEALRPRQREQLEARLDVELWDDGQREALANLRKYIWLRTAGSEFYRRMFRRVINRYPHFIQHLGDPDRLLRHATGFLAGLENGELGDRWRSQLGDYYDVSYLACAVEALVGAPFQKYRADFVSFADEYMANLYVQCRRLARDEAGKMPTTHDLFAVLASGGFARGQAFGGDYDLIFLLNSDDPEAIDFFRMVASRFHRELAARGTIPQYRFADHFGEFVVTQSQLRDWFASGNSDTVDRAQVLGARLVVGNTRVYRELFATVVEPHVFDRFGQFAHDMVTEMKLRQAACCEPTGDRIPIKEGVGGLWDIEHISLVLKARYRLLEPTSTRLLELLAERAPEVRDEALELADHHAFLRRVRDLYRLLVAAEDELCDAELAAVARILAEGKTEVGDGPALGRTVRQRMQRVAEIVDRLLRKCCILPPVLA
jgi:hypothetical protein